MHAQQVATGREIAELFVVPPRLVRELVGGHRHGVVSGEARQSVAVFVEDFEARCLARNGTCRRFAPYDVLCTIPSCLVQGMPSGEKATRIPAPRLRSSSTKRKVRPVVRGAGGVCAWPGEFASAAAASPTRSSDLRREFKVAGSRVQLGRRGFVGGKQVRGPQSCGCRARSALLSNSSPSQNQVCCAAVATTLFRRRTRAREINFCPHPRRPLRSCPKTL